MLYLSLLILLLATLRIVLAITVEKLNITCNGSTANMGCFKVPREFSYDITCPNQHFSEKINVMYKGFSRSLLMHIICEHFDERNYCMLSKIPTANNTIIKVQMENCAVSTNHTYLDVSKRLGLEHITALEINNYDVTVNFSSDILKGLSELKSLTLRTPNFTHIMPNIFRNMHKLESLVLKKNNISQMSSFTLSGLENLISLDLSYNNLETIPEDFFKGTPNIEHLYLAHNSLRNLSKVMFENSTSVIRLDLSSNNIDALQANVFSGMVNLNYISLGNNNFSTLPTELFAHNLQLRELLLTHNRIPLKVLPNKLLSNLAVLQNVTLNCNLEELPAELFANSSALKTITISGNNLETLPVDLLVDQHNLYYLDLSNNGLTYLPDGIFESTDNLMVLQLTNNELREINDKLFQPLKRLEVLLMENNHIKIIDPKAFALTKSLRHVNLENNEIDFSNNENKESTELWHITDVSPFQYLTKLITLNLSYNKINRIYRDWKFQLPRLEQLDLSYNELLVFHSADLQFLAVNDLVVNLTYNHIKYVNFDALDQLTFPSSRGLKVNFDINHNPINCNCGILKFVQFLQQKEEHHSINSVNIKTEHLKCEEPQKLVNQLLEDISPKDLLCQLETILPKHKQKTCPDVCECLVRKYDAVLIVNCNNRHLDEVPALPPVKSLNLVATELYIEDNNITILPHNDTPGYADITRLYMARNDLFKINAFNVPAGLTHLDVRYNHVCKLSEDVLKIFNSSRMISLRLSHNPWECNCENIPLLVFVHRNRNIEDFQQMRCHMSQYDMQPLQELTVNDICPQDKGPVIALAVSISFIGLFLGLIVALYYKYQQEIKVWLYAHNLCLWLVTEEELDKDKKYDAFISYSHKDDEFVEDVLLDELETGSTPYKLCIHKRDWLAGEWVQDQIIRSVQESRRTIVVLSENFINSVWTRMEFRTAHQEALEEKRPRVIIIIYGDIGDIDKLDPLLKVYLKMNTYLKWGEPNFWNKLRYAMPHSTKKLRCDMRAHKKLNNLNNNCHIVMNENNTLEFIDTNINYNNIDNLKGIKNSF